MKLDLIITGVYDKDRVRDFYPAIHKYIREGQEKNERIFFAEYSYNHVLLIVIEEGRKSYKHVRCRSTGNYQIFNKIM